MESRERRGWQEDDGSRLLLEFGVPGLLLLAIAAAVLLGVFRRALRVIPPGSSLRDLQVGLMGIVVGDGLCYLISHQVFSGDPVSALFVVFLAGTVLGLPQIYQRAVMRMEAWRSERGNRRSKFGDRSSGRGGEGAGGN